MRIAGFLYLAIILLGLFGEVIVRAKLVVSGNPAATAHAIADSQRLWRGGIVGEFSFCVWMIVKGVNLAQWQQRADRVPST